MFLLDYQYIYQLQYINHEIILQTAYWCTGYFDLFERTWLARMCHNIATR